MRYLPIKSDFYFRNRKKMVSVMEPNSVAIFFSAPETTRNADQFYKYRQNSNLFYLCGIDQPKTILLIAPDNKNINMREIIFVMEADEKMIIWEGHKLSISEVRQISGVQNVFNTSEMEEKVNEVFSNSTKIYSNISNFKFKESIFEGQFEFFSKIFSNPILQFQDIDNKLKKLRTIKSLEEIVQIRNASEVTNKAFRNVLATKLSGFLEYQVESIITGVFHYYGCEHAYQPIVAGGENACVLHYIKNDCVCNDGDLLLMDFGAEYGNYASDCSRTIPVSGKFTDRQKDCYNAVLRTFKKARELFIPGNTINHINKLTDKWIEEEMIKLGLFSIEDVNSQDSSKPLFRNYYMHGVSHFLGLDVHDVGDKDMPFEKGMVFTCEPGIYIREEKIGIRIENDILVDEIPIDLMAEIPLEIEEIEKLMNMS
ncbi:MAG: aminopeptidase P N-terminal domain-containing protein [Bacteroidales bacterium]|nr:aminopeptidase P N-terminal domain-containing protein [Bacteroidales bacterium]